MLTVAIEAYALKDTLRTGWVLRGIDDPESVAGHSWGTALLCLLFGGAAGVDVGRAVQIAVVHDMAEARVGDIPARMQGTEPPPLNPEKVLLEREAMDSLASLAERGRSDGRSDGGGPMRPVFRDLWQEYEDGTTPEARFVRDMNLIDMCLTAYLYERDSRYADPSGTPEGVDHFPDYARLDEFFATSRTRISTTTGHRLFAEVEELYLGVRRNPT